MRVILCLLCVAVCLTGVRPNPLWTSTKAEGKAASHEDVSVLMYGVLQFSESLHHIYETTNAKMARIARSLKSHEGTLERLGQEAKQAEEVERQIKEVIGLIQTQMAGMHAQAELTKGKLTQVEQEEVELKNKVANLETYLKNALPTRIIELQERALTHSNILRSLLHLTQHQRRNLESQNTQLNKLQSLSETMR